MTGASLLSPELAGIINRVFDRNQQRVFAEKISEVINDGFGEVTIEIQKGRVRFVKVISSHDLTPEQETISMRADKR